MAEEADESVVQCKCGPLSAHGTYKIEGRFLIVESTLGEIKANLGLLEPGRAAQRMLKNVCTAAAKKMKVPVMPPKVRL